MFKLTADELDSAFDAINHHGYSAMLPEPVEWTAVRDHWPEVRAHIQDLDLDVYVPRKAMKVFAPKSRANVRVTHLLHPQDLIIYTGLVLIAKSDIENSRIPKKSRRVFSYRVDTARSDRLYDARGAYASYLGELAKKSSKTSVKFVGTADIADFYPSIYQHRLENVIEAVATSQRVKDVARVLVKKLVSHLMDKNSYGIPVGPYASRLLAEAVLIDVDAYLHSNGVDFVRWVDDYNIFCRTEYETQSTLFELGEWLYSQHGLKFQSAKTRILPKKRFVKEVLTSPDDNLSDRDVAISLLRELKSEYDSEAVEDEELDEEEIQQKLEELQGLDLHGMLERTISEKAIVDYEIVKYVLSRLPRIPGASEELKEDVLDLIINNADLLYPASEYVAKYIISFSNISKIDKKKIARKLLKPLKSKRKPPPAYYAMWMLHIFTTSADWNHMKEVVDLYRTTNSDIVKRYTALAIATGGSRAEALSVKEDFPAASDLLRLAILTASRKLGTDERKHWRQSQNLRGPIEKIV